MPSTDASSTSLAIEMCFSCSVRPCEYKVACQLPCCDRFRGKIQVCSKCAEFCPNPKCRNRLRPQDLKTASHLSTLQTFTELRSLDVLVEQAEGEAAKGKLNANGAKGKGKTSKGRGKGKLQTSSEQQVGALGAKESGSHVKEVQVDGDLFVNSTMLSILRSRPLFMLARVPVGIACSCRLKSSLDITTHEHTEWVAGNCWVSA